MEEPLILIADDDPDVRVTLAMELRKRHFRVIEAKNGIEAVKLGVQHKPVLAILDFRMPGMSGLEASIELKLEADIPSYFLSGIDDQEMVRRTTDAGSLGYFLKPDDIDSTIDSIEAALEKAIELHRMRNTEERLEDTLPNGRDVCIATGILMRQLQMDITLAYGKLTEAARLENKDIHDFAAELVRLEDKHNNFINKLVTTK